MHRVGMYFSSPEATLRVYPNGVSALTILVGQVNDYFFGARNVPDGLFLRLTKVDGTEGNFGEAPLIPGFEGKAQGMYGAVILCDRPLGPSNYLTVALCNPDGSEITQLKYVLDIFSSTDGTWPKPDATPPVPTIPPVMPTPTPTPRPAFGPDATEPPRDLAIGWEPFQLSHYLGEDFSLTDAQLRLYPDGFSVLTVQFRYEKDLPDGSVLDLYRVSGVENSYGQALITRGEDHQYTAVIFCNQHFPFLEYIALHVLDPDGNQLLNLLLHVKPHHYPQSTWPKVAPITNTIISTPAPTEQVDPPHFVWDSRIG